MNTEAYQHGADARLSGDPEPACPYEPGTFDYSDFADGFCEAKPLIVPTYYGEWRQ